MDEMHEILLDRQAWNRAAPERQDQAIESVAQALGPALAWQETRSYTCQEVSHRIATFRHQKTRIDLQLIPGGEYVQGSPDLEAELAYARRFYPNRDRDFVELEEARPVTVAPLLIGRFPVTYAQWGKLQRRWKGQEWKGRSFPLEKVSWKQVQGWLAKAGDGLRLPWASEWEYACRAGTETRFYWGEEMDPAYCWEQSNSGGETHPVTEHADRPNGFGLVDTLGNVAEWCQDEYQDWETWYADDYYLTRGGSARLDAAFCRCANVGMVMEGASWRQTGFRVALSVPEGNGGING